MATYHCSIKNGKSGNGKAHSDYILREGDYAYGTKKEELVYKQFGNLPPWSASPAEFFAKADLYERKNGNVYTEFEIALPNELSLEENIKLVQRFVEENVGNNKVYCFAIHEKNAALDEKNRQPHAHIMFSERIIENKQNIKPDYQFFKNFKAKNTEWGGYKKDDRFTAKNGIGPQNVLKVRESLEKIINETYEKNGLDVRISCKSLKDLRAEAMLKNDKEQYDFYDRPAQNHLGPKLANQMKKQMKKPDFQFKHLSDKARLYVLSKEIQTTCNEIRKYKKIIEELRQLEAQEKLNIVSLKADLAGKTPEEITLNGTKFANRLYASAFTIGNKVKENNQRIEAVQKFILSDERIHKIALSVYTKGQSKELDKEKRKVVKLRKDFDAAFDKFAQKPMPKWHELNYKREYNDEKNKLLKWQNDVLEREKNLAAKLEIYEAELRKPEHIAGIKEIEAALHKKNEVRKEYINNLKQSNKNLKAMGRQLLALNNKLLPGYNYKLDKNAADFIKKSNLEKQHGHDQTLQNKLENSINKLKAAVNKARDEQVKGGMKADLSIDIKDNNIEI